MDTATAQQLRRLLVQRLESLRMAGVRDLPRPGRRPARAEPVVAPAGTGAAAAPASGGIHPATGAARAQPLLSGDGGAATNRADLSRDQRIEALDQLRGDVARCRRCSELAATRTQTVFGVGNPQARLVFLGEAPGSDEDRQGEPFVGRAGELLNKILGACTLRREDVYILNILKCRPPGNRTPTAQEAANCREYLLGQLAIIRPEYLCCLGAVAAQNLLETTAPIGQLRGRFHRFQQIKVLATYHPAYLLRNPSAKRAVWDDLQMLLADMGIQLPTPR